MIVPNNYRRRGSSPRRPRIPQNSTARRLAATLLTLVTAASGAVLASPSAAAAVPTPVAVQTLPATPAKAQHPGHPGHDDESVSVFSDEAATDWANYELVSLADGIADAIDMAVLPDGRVLSTVRTGGIRLTDPAAGTTELVNQLDVYTTGEMGMQTITLDPDFATNKWVYLYYAPTKMKPPYAEQVPSGNAPGTLPAGQTAAYWDVWKGYTVLSRFKWDDAANKLNIASEQEILKVETNRGQCCHQGGDVAFDAAGNLYLSTGDNTGSGAGGSGGFAPINDLAGNNPGFDSRRSAGNTNDLRGKILRIKVAADGTYTSPADNLFPETGPNADKTRPEIYVMGVRNPFRIDVDKQSGTLMWGDYGPDAGRADPKRGPMGYVEWNAVPTTGGAHNSGWPFCVGDNSQPYNDWNWDTQTPGPFFDCDNLKNDSSGNTGLVNIPPAVDADLWYGDRNCRTEAEGCDQPWPELQSFSENIEQAPMAGPIYRYNAASTSETKLPEYWNGKAFFGEYSQDYLAAFTFDAPQGAVTKIENVFPNGELGAAGYPLWDGIIDLEFGSNGSLYVLNYISQKLVRLDYSPLNKRPQPVITATPTSGGSAPMTVQFDASASTDPDDDALTYAWDFTSNGSTDATGPTASFTYPTLGQYRARLTATDVFGKATVASVTISVGNTAPVVNIVGLPDGGFIDWGKAAIYQVGVTDPDDTTAVACNRTRYTMYLGHSSHAHPFTTGIGCKIGVPTFPDAPAEHGTTEDLYSVLEVAYTDAGANGVPAATGTTKVLLNPKALEAEYAEDHQGTTTVDDLDASATRSVSSIEATDWLAFKPVNFSGITGVTARVRGTGELALRWNSPTATPFATMPVTAGTALADATVAFGAGTPTGSGTLYVTGQSGNVTLDVLNFAGPGVGDVQTPTVTGVWNPATPTGQNGWYTTNPTLTLTPVDNGSIYSREYSVDNGASWQQISYADQYGSGRELGNTLVFTDPGESTVLFRVRDTSQNISTPGSITVKIDTIKPTINLTGITGGIATGSIGISATDPAPGSGSPTITSVTVDGQPAATDTVNAAALPGGTHQIVVKARDLAGNEQTRTESFRTGDVVNPVVVATLTPAVATGNNAWYLEPVTLALNATDNVGVVSRQYSLDAGVTWLDADAQGKAVISKEGANSVRYRALDAQGNISTVGTIAVNIDTRIPTIEYPQVTAGRIGNSAVLTPKIGDQLPGSGDGSRNLLNSSAILEMTLDGKRIPIVPLDLSTLSVGKHTLVALVNDPAGNAAEYSLVFVNSTSFQDFATLVDRFESKGALKPAVASTLRSQIALVEEEALRGRTAQATAALNKVRNTLVPVKAGAARDALRLTVDGLALIIKNQEPSTSGTGLTATRVATPRALPAVTVTKAPEVPNAKFDTLIIARTQGFRHTQIPDAIVAIQKMGQDNGFNVDLWDPTLPTASVAVNPLLSLDTLSKYETVVFNSTTGNANFSAVEQAVIEQYIRNGGGYVGVHAASDCCRQWQWYRDLVGGVFIAHPQGPLGQNPPCETCFDGVVATEDTVHPATAGLPARWAINDEWYNLTPNPRGDVHVLQSLDESTLRDNLNIIRTGQFANGYNTLMGDHPISWCQNYDGGRAFTQVIGHNRALWQNPDYLRTIQFGILTTAGQVAANCVSFREVDTLIASLGTSGAVRPATVSAIEGGLDDARADYMAKNPAEAIKDLELVNATIAQQVSTGAAKNKLFKKVDELIDWMENLEGGDRPGQTFSDVPETSPFASAIAWAADLGITSGYEDGTFRPSVAISRDAVAAMLYRAVNTDWRDEDQPTCTVAPFTDVPVTHRFCGEISWLKAQGITTGNTDGSYGPSSKVTRQAVAAMLARAFGPTTLPVCTSAPFSDVAVGSQFCGEIQWLKQSGLTTGFGNGTFGPGRSIERQAFVAFLYRQLSE